MYIGNRLSEPSKECRRQSYLQLYRIGTHSSKRNYWIAPNKSLEGMFAQNYLCQEDGSLKEGRLYLL